MAFLSGLSVGKQPSPALGAITGFAGGLARGMQDAEQIKAQRMRLALAQQEMNLRQQAFAHGLEKENQVQDWSRALGEYKAWRAGTGDEIQTPGQLQVGPDDDPASAQANGKAMSPARSTPNIPAIDEKLMALAKSIPDARTRDAFLETVQQEERTRAAAKGRDTLLDEIRNRRLQKGYRSVNADGAEETVGDELAMSFEEQLSALDPESDPDQVAAITDKIRAADQQHRLDTANHNFQIGQRQRADMGLETAIAEKEAQGVPTDEARYLQSLWRAGILPDEMMAKMMPDALNGTLALKIKLAQQEQELNQMRLEAVRGSMAPGGPGGLDRQRIPEGGYNGVSLERTRMNGSGGGVKTIDRGRMIQDEMKELRGSQEFMNKPEAEIRRQATENVDAALGEQDAGDPEEAALKKLLKSLGVDPERQVQVNGSRN